MFNKASKRKDAPAATPFKIFYRPSGDGYNRVWRHDWPGDSFDVVDDTELEMIRRVTSRFSIPFSEYRGD